MKLVIRNLNRLAQELWIERSLPSSKFSSASGKLWLTRYLKSAELFSKLINRCYLTDFMRFVLELFVNILPCNSSPFLYVYMFPELEIN